MPNLPKSLLGPKHLEFLNDAQAVLENLQYHIDQAKRAGVPGMDEHQKSKDDSLATVARFKEVYFHGQ